MKGAYQDLESDALRNNIGNRCFGSAGVAEGTNANTLQFAAAISFSIANKVYTKAITDNIAMTAAVLQADLTDCMYLVSINAAGTVTITKGTELATGGAVVLPELPDDNAPVCAMKIALSGGTFKSGTTDLSGAGVTDTYTDLSGMTSESF